MIRIRIAEPRRLEPRASALRVPGPHPRLEPARPAVLQEGRRGGRGPPLDHPVRLGWNLGAGEEDQSCRHRSRGSQDAGRRGRGLVQCRVEGRAALYSLGFLLRRAAAVLLDINEWDLRVGLRVVGSAQGNVIGQVFLSDALENGAGYCSQFATPSAMERLLRFVSDPAFRLRPSDNCNTFLAPIIAANHSDECQTSCHDCLRDYSNLAWHNILDWRMALDVARLALDGNAPVDYTTPYWQPLVATATTPYFRALGWTEIRLGGLPAARSGSRRGTTAPAGGHRPSRPAAHSRRRATGRGRSLHGHR